MNAIRIVARKELRTYFESPVALIFLGIFLLATLFAFFSHSSFFARNIADVRPLFAWLPLLLIFLVAAITMRQWAEERKMGTLEVLLTLPVDTRDLVLGKFLAGMSLVAIALAMTLPIPIMVSMLGSLDWGPVVGGYLGALLLGGTYLAIGLCISARTDNQVVSLMLTLLIAGAIYLLGSDTLTQFFGNRGSDLLRALGTGSRFASIERGVLDLRDLAYYVGLGVFFLGLNWYFLESERLDRDAPEGHRRARRLLALVALIGLNALALDLWLAPIARLRVDLTERGEYSISPVTQATLDGLAEPLRLDGYFSERTHPLLAPLVPQIRDLLAEYAIHGGGRVEVNFADPNADEALEQELGERYGIRSVPFRVADRHQQAVVNSYFHVLVRYGDRHETLSFDDLIEVRFDEDEIEVRLENLEYDLTRAIKRVSQDFESMETILAGLPENARLTVYVTPATLPEDFAGLPDRIRKLANEFVERSSGKLSFEEIDPSGRADLQDQLEEHYGIRPLAVDLFGRQTFYLDLVLESGARAQRIMPRSDLSDAELRSAFEAAVRRIAPGQLKTIGLYTETPVPPPLNPQLPPQLQPPPPRPDYQGLRRVFGEEYVVETVDLESGIVPEHIDVLLVGKAGDLDARKQFALDQYLMRGGKLIALAGRFGIDLGRGGLSAARQESALFDLLSTWGVSVDDALVLDPQNASFPIPVEEQRGMFRVQRIRMLPYPFFVDVREDGYAARHPALVGLQNVTVPWASPVRAVPSEGVTAQVLLQSSPRSWLDSSGRIEPDLRTHPDVGFAPTGELGRQPLAVALEGRFTSHFAARPSPLFEPAEGESASDESADATGRTLKQSMPDARLLVIGSNEIVSDLMLQISDQPGGEVHRSDVQLIQNLVDWAVEDTDLLAIRSSGAFARTLRPMSEAEARAWELGQYGTALAMLVVVAVVPRRRRRNLRPLALPPASRSGSEGAR